MDEPADLEARVSALEDRIEVVAADAAAARHLAAAGDRDLADLGIKVDANRAAINALGLQLGGRLSGVEGRLSGVERRLDGHDARFDVLERRFDTLEGRFDTLEGRFDTLEHRVNSGFAEVATGFAEMRGRFDATAAGQQTVVDLLTRLIDDPPTD